MLNFLQSSPLRSTAPIFLFIFCFLFFGTGCEPNERGAVTTNPDLTGPFLEDLEITPGETYEWTDVTSIDVTNSSFRGGTATFFDNPVFDSSTADTIRLGQVMMGAPFNFYFDWVPNSHPTGAVVTFEKNGQQRSIKLDRPLRGYHLALGSAANAEQVLNGAVIILKNSPMMGDELANLPFYNPNTDYYGIDDDEVIPQQDFGQTTIGAQPCDIRVVQNVQANGVVLNASVEEYVLIQAEKYLVNGDSTYFINAVFYNFDLLMWEKYIWIGHDFTILPDGSIDVNIFQTASLIFHGYRESDGSTPNVPNATLNPISVNYISNQAGLDNVVDSWYYEGSEPNLYVTHEKGWTYTP